MLSLLMGGFPKSKRETSYFDASLMGMDGNENVDRILATLEPQDWDNSATIPWAASQRGR